jgi:RNA polymerase sigma-70 factor (ECF subfamily)
MYESNKIVEQLKKRDESALEQVMKQYTPIVSTIIYNVSGGLLSTSDIEETVADVFITLWKNIDKIYPDKLKGYICCIAKSKAKNKIRSLSKSDTIDIEKIVAIDDFNVETEIENIDINSVLNEAIKSIGEPDSEIILRHYYYYQTSAKIAEIMKLNHDTVKSKIRRAKEKLKKYLIERGFYYEDT